jgi:hypothetical protein
MTDSCEDSVSMWPVFRAAMPLHRWSWVVRTCGMNGTRSCMIRPDQYGRIILRCLYTVLHYEMTVIILWMIVLQRYLSFHLAPVSYSRRVTNGSSPFSEITGVIAPLRLACLLRIFVGDVAPLAKADPVPRSLLSSAQSNAEPVALARRVAPVLRPRLDPK